MTSYISLEVGDRIVEPARTMTRERMRWYCDARETATMGSGKFVLAEPTIHDDDEIARANGLRGIIADGMISTNWISSMLYRSFGMHYLANGDLRTKFVRPIYENEQIETYGSVLSVEPTAEGSLFGLKVWCQTIGQDVCTVGEARVAVTADESLNESL